MACWCVVLLPISKFRFKLTIYLGVVADILSFSEAPAAMPNLQNSDFFLSRVTILIYHFCLSVCVCVCVCVSVCLAELEVIVLYLNECTNRRTF